VEEASILKVISERINSSGRIVLATHISPDPDAIGSSGALCLSLRLAGKDAVLYLPEPLSEKLSKLLPRECTINILPEPDYLLIGLDCATKKRLGVDSGPVQSGQEKELQSYERLLGNANYRINIDHHFSNEEWGDINWIEGDWAATAIMVFRLLEASSLPIDPKIAGLLYAGIMDDTGSFRYSNTSSDALSTCASLLSAGARPWDIADTLYFQEPLRIIKLRGRVLETLDVDFSGKVASLWLTEEMRIATGCQPDDSEGMIDIARAIEGVELALFIRQINQNKWKGSIRSKSEKYNVSTFASQFGGGGHSAASGFTIEGSSQDEVAKRLKQALEVFLLNGQITSS